MIPRRVESVGEKRLLILAGAPEDAELVKGALRKTGLSFQSKQVDSESAFARALAEFAPTIVLAASKVLGYSARAALDHVRRTHPEIPVIVLADSPPAAAAVELVKAGAKDVVFKRDIPKDGADRLAHAIVQALTWEEGRRQRKEAEEALRESEERFRDIAENLPGAVFRRLLKPDGSIAFAYVSEGFREIFGIVPGELASGDLGLIPYRCNRR